MDTTEIAIPVIELEPFVHNGYDLVKKPIAGFLVHYGKWRWLMFRCTEESARTDGEAYLRTSGRWVEPKVHP